MKKFTKESKLNIKIGEEKKIKSRELPALLICFFASAGILLTFFTSLGLEKYGFSVSVSIISLCVFFVLNCFVYIERTGIKEALYRQKTVILISAFVGLSILCLVLRHDLNEGLRALMQAVSIRLTESSGLIYPNFSTGSSGLSNNIISVLFSFMIYGILSFALRNGVAILPLILICMEIYSVNQGILKNSILLGISILLLIVSCMFSIANMGFRLASLKAIASCTAVMVFIAIIAFVPFTQSKLLTQNTGTHMIDSLKSSYHHKKYGGTKLLTRGNLEDIKSFEPSKRVQLEITMSNPEPMYLRSFVGEKLKDNKWEKLSGENLSKVRDDFYWLRKDGFYAQALLAKGNKAVNGGLEASDLSVLVVNADSQNVYLPYSFYQDSKGMYMDSLIGDSELEAKGSASKNYTLKYLNNSVKDAYVNQKKLGAAEVNGSVDEKYLKNEAVYRNFVYDNYLEIEDSQRTILRKLLGKAETLSGTEAKIKIANFAAKNWEYDESSSSLGADNELNAFLTKTKTGKSELYASAAVQMLRYYGVPARYAEGYVISEKMISGKRGNEDNTKGKDESQIGDKKPADISVTEENAHAWCEYYLDGIGWIPFDITPKYRGEIKFTQTDDAIESEMGGNKGLESGEHKSSEKEEETKDTDDKRENPINSQTAVFTYGPLYALIVLLLVLIALIIIIAIRRYRLKLFVRSLETGEPVQAVKKCFSYAMYFVSLKIDGFESSFIKENKDEIIAAFPGAEDLFDKAAAVNDKARYAFDKTCISESDREIILEFCKNIIANFCSERNFAQKIFDKYIRAIY